MHSINSGWSGQAFAVASSNDTGGKKSRIRRSKEERKGMVESFIQKYQKTNEGNFPSLNLTHKEVGGSFYTVREIVREIIQENRVLAPPKISLDAYDDSGFLEHHPLGSISTEPQSDFSITDAIQTMHSQNPNTSEDHNLNYSMQFHEPDSLKLDNNRVLNGLSKELDDSAPNNHQHTGMDQNPSHQFVIHKSEEFGKEMIVNGDKTKEIGQQISLDSNIMEVIDGEKDGASNMGLVRSDVVVETFPLRPVSSAIVDVNAGSGKLHEAAIELQDDATQHDKITFDHSSVDLVNQMDGVKDQESKEPLPDGTKIDNSSEQLTSESNVSLHKGSNPTLDRINLGTWEGVSKNSPRRDSNPILAIVKAFVSAFMKFWTE